MKLFRSPGACSVGIRNVHLAHYLERLAARAAVIRAVI